MYTKELEPPAFSLAVCSAAAVGWLSPLWHSLARYETSLQHLLLLLCSSNGTVAPLGKQERTYNPNKHATQTQSKKQTLLCLLLSLRLSWALSLKTDMMDKLDKMDKPQQPLQRPQSCGGLLWSMTPTDGAASPTISKWTPPLSPTSSGNRSAKRTTPTSAGVDLEKRPSAAEAVAMLKRSGVPALEGVKMLRHMVGAAPRAWVRDFKIRGGRSVCLLFSVLQSVCCYLCSSYSS